MRDTISKRLLREEEGFTLAEVMVTMMIMIMVLFALYSIFDMSLRVFGFGNSKVEAVENARLGLEKMEREIRAAYPYDKGAATPDTHLFDSGTWTATRIRFGNDLDGNWKVQCPTALGGCEEISYQVYDSGGGDYSLGRSNSSAGTLEPVVEYLDYVDATDTGLTFRYFKSDGTTEISPGGDESQVAMVRIEIRIRVENGTQDGTQTLTTDVALKNRGQ